VIEVFIKADNRFGRANLKCCIPTVHKAEAHARHLHKFREVPFSVLYFLQLRFVAIPAVTLFFGLQKPL
jgi:hypothetical protein